MATAGGRRALMRRQLNQSGLAEQKGERASSDGDRPLSPGQRRLWSIQQLDPMTIGYNVAIALDLAGELDADALGEALSGVVGAHDILRTTYHADDTGEAVGAVTQVVHDELPPRFDTYSVTDPARVEALAQDLASEPFDLAKDSPVRMRVIETGPADNTVSTLVVVLHHIVWDDGSATVFFGELVERYRAIRSGAGQRPGRAEWQYADVAEAAERALTEQDRADGLAYWRDQLDPLPEPVSLPGLSGGRGAGRDQFVPLRPGIGGRVRELARAEGVSLYMVLFAAVSALFYRSTGRTDFVIGAPVVNRDLPGGGEVFGYLSNTIALRAEVDPGRSFRALLADSRATCLAGYSHQYVELDDVARAADPKRERADTGLFNVVLSVRPQVLDLFAAAGLSATRRNVPGSEARFDLTLAFEIEHDDLTAVANFPAGETEESAAAAEAQVRLLMGHLDRLLHAALTDPDTPVAELDLFAEGERDRLLGELNRTEAPAETRPFPELFAAAVARTPDAPAVLDPAGGSLTYGELHARANRLGRELAVRGIGPGDLVALSVPRSPEMMVAALGVLAAGAAYVPVDPEYPEDRVRLMLTDSAARLVLHTSSVWLPDEIGETLALDDPAVLAALAGHPDGTLTAADRTVPLHPDHPAYVIYTSGSTGVPKGVLVAHRALSNHLDWALRRFVGLAGHTLMHSSISFDFTVTPMLGTLLAGGRLELCEDSPDAIAGAVGEATFLKVTPSHLPLLDSVRFARDAARTLVIAGEALHGEALADWRAPATGHTDVINEYGPTEACVGCLLYDVPDSPGPGAVPVGHPVTNTTAHVLDPRMRLVPIGVTGELYVGGAQLAQGYLGRPGLSATRFVADPFGPPGARLYRTGDRVRRRPDGALEFLGRVDDQVKIRGFRVELGEIEAALARHPSVAQAVVSARTDGPGGVYLAGYAVLSEPGVTGAELRDYLRESLPEHMVPAAVLVLGALPLSPSGKVDRRALPAPEFVSAGRGGRGRAPSSAPDGDTAGPASREPETPAERRLTELFSEVLGGREVGVTDSFFELGGDSILVISLVSKARKAGLKLTPREVFEHRTIEALAAAMPEPVGEAAAPAPTASDEVGEVVPSPIQRAFAARGPLGERHHMWLLLEVPALTERPLTEAVRAVLDRHAALRAVLRTGEERQRNDPQHRPEPRLEIRPAGAVAPGSVLRRVAGADAETVAGERAAAVASLDPAAGELVRVVWFDDPVASRLLLVVHHLVVDGVSLRILAGDLAAAFRAASTGGTPELEPVGTSLRGWAAGLAARAADRAGELELWRGILSGPRPAVGSRPYDPAEDTWPTVRTHTATLDAELTESALGTVPNAFFAGPEDVLLAALGLALAGWRDDLTSVPVLLEGHGREEAAVPGADLSRTVGWFSSQYPARLDVTGVDLADAFGGGPAAGELVKRVKEQLRGMPDRGIGYGMLRRLAGAEQLAQFAEPELSFNYLGRFGAGGTGDDWPVAPDGFGAGYDPAMPALAGLALNVLCVGDRITAHWMYASGLFAEEEVARLAGRWRDALRGLARHAEGPGSGGHTPSDMPLVSLSQAQLDALEAKWGGR